MVTSTDIWESSVNYCRKLMSLHKQIGDILQVSAHYCEALWLNYPEAESGELKAKIRDRRDRY